MKHKGFTLVEMLAVIAIIGILASMLTGALMMVNVKVKQAAIAVEIGNLSLALENYKSQYGEYPPDGFDATAINRHLKKVFPRSTKSMPITLDASSALVFWLGGVMSNGRPIGFAANPTDPFNANEGIPRKAPFYEFNPEQLNGYQYTAKSGGAPYVYFRATVSNNIGKFGSKKYDASGDGYGIALPYKLKNGVWAAEKKYQIIHPGMDGMYSGGADMTSSSIWRSTSDNSQSGSITEGDLDNVTNFTQGNVGDMLE